MKKLISVMLALLLTACSSQAKVDNTPPAEYKVVCNYIEDFATGEGCVYEVFDHSDGTTDILVTDLHTAVRQQLNPQTTIQSPYGSQSGIFYSDGFLYHITKENNIGSETIGKNIIYQYSPDGKLINKTEVKDVTINMFSAVISDGNNLYFSGYEKAKDDTYVSCVVCLNPETLDTSVVYKAENNISFWITGAYKDRLIINTATKSTSDGKSNIGRSIQLLDIKTGTRELLFELENGLCEQLDAGRLFTENGKNGIDIYNIETGECKTVVMFEDGSEINYCRIPYKPMDNRLFVFTSQGVGNYYINYVYDIETGEITDTALALTNKLKSVTEYVDGYYLILIGEETIQLTSGGRERIDYKFAWVEADVLYNGGEEYTPVENKIEYR